MIHFNVPPPSLSGNDSPRASSAAPLLVYVHFPWCLAKCPYCDFVSFATNPADIDHDRYADAVIAELEGRALALANAGALPRVESIFVGGGTPSLWQPSALGRVIAAITSTFPTTHDIEIAR
jgi:coproporphyrinogen III oxidase-like Fe-S oxidoreductase